MGRDAAAAFLQKVDRMNPEALPAIAVLSMATDGGARAIGLGDNPNLAVCYAAGRKDSRALFEGSLVFLRVFAAEFAPVVAGGGGRSD